MMRNLFLAAVLACGLLSGAPAAHAQLADNSATINTTAVQVVPAVTTRNRAWLYLQNRSTNNISCAFGNATPTVLGPGTFTLIGQGASFFLQYPSLLPGEAVYCIASAITSPITALSIP